MKSLMSQEHVRSSRRVWTNSVFATVAIGLAALAMGCTDPEKPETPGGTAGSGGGGTAGSGGGGGGAGGSGGEGGGGVEMPGVPEYVVKFDWTMGELGEGLAVDGKTAYVSFGSTKIIKVDLETGARSDFGSINGPIGVANPQGLSLDSQKNVYVAVHSTTPADFKPGIYKIPAAGGAATLFAENVDMSYPRHIHWVDASQAVISVPPGSRLMKMTNTGMIEQLGLGQDFGGDQSSMCAWGEGIPYGVTSVAVDSGIIFGTNADKATIFGDMGPIAGPDCSTLGGAESILIDPYDKGATGLETTFFVAARRVNKITRVRYLDTAEVTVVSDSADLHEPSAIAMAVLGSDRYLIILNSARTTYNTGGVPGLLKMRLGAAK